MLNPRTLLFSLAFGLAGCATSHVQPLDDGTYEIRVDHEAVSSELVVEREFRERADALCPRGFTRLSERDNVEGQFGGRTFVIRCVE
ncbi:MAG: hypothetical protein CMM50_09550 [Rhodospirillaceae bacterium]|nr:hypothetical protein [Rhodospirillaceae bacterium]|tara:strand:+ start:230 stop:490 length:261 start_codon:yes stop_codon:yes gene_type:complete